MKTSKPTSTSTLTPQYLLAGSLSAVLGDAVAFPLDTIKVRMQAEGIKGKYAGTIDCIKQTFRKEGMRGFYRGMQAPLLLTGVINSVLFGMQFSFVQLLKSNSYQIKVMAYLYHKLLIDGWIIRIF